MLAYEITQTRTEPTERTFQVSFPDRPDLDFETTLFFHEDTDSWEEVNCDSVVLIYEDLDDLQYDILDDLRSRC